MTKSQPPRKPQRARGRPKKKKVRPAKISLATHQEKNVAIAILRNQGKSCADIVAATGVSKTTVLRGGFATPRKERPGDDDASPTNVSPGVKDRRKLVKRIHKKNPRANSQDIVWALAKEEIHVSKRTVARDQKALGARHLTCDRVQRLSELQKANRLKWCKKLLREHPEDDPWWRSLVFSDESMRGTSDMDHTCWVFPGEARQQRQQARWDFKIHVWGYIGTDGVRCIRQVKGSVVKESYLELLKSTIGKRPWKDKRTWQQDNATAHTAAVVREWLKANVNCLEDWPANSPDLSPIENLWGRMWSDAVRLRPTTADELWSCVEKVFSEYPEEYTTKLVMSFRRRLLKCVEVKGDSVSGDY